jgi:hypothetical protein
MVWHIRSPYPSNQPPTTNKHLSLSQPSPQRVSAYPNSITRNMHNSIIARSQQPCAVRLAVSETQKAQ